MACVTPLFKDGAQDCRDNFRPISVLSILSKVCEKHVAVSLMDYLVKTGLLYEFQSAFRAGHSTESALISFTDQILFNLPSPGNSAFRQTLATIVITGSFRTSTGLPKYRLHLSPQIVRRQIPQLRDFTQHLLCHCLFKRERHS